MSPMIFHRWVLVSALTLPVAFSLGEICSKYPTSAGAYYWCFRLASPKRRLLLSWINGWLTMVGVWTVSLSVTFVRVFMVVATSRMGVLTAKPGDRSARRCRSRDIPS